MNKSDPIKNLSDIEHLKSYFNNNDREWLLFSIGINVPLKTNELLSLKVSQLNKKQNLYYFNINGYTIFLSQSISNRLSDYILKHNYGQDDYIFQSAKTKKVLTRQQLHRLLTYAKNDVQYKGVLSCQSLKKTFAYQAYVKGLSIRQIQHLCGHQTKLETYKFIDVSVEEPRFIQLNL